MACRTGAMKKRARRFVWKAKDIKQEKPMTETLYSVFTVSEGGFGQRLALELLRGEGISAAPATSPYVGQTGVIVYGGKRVQKKADKILFNY